MTTPAAAAARRARAIFERDIRFNALLGLTVDHLDSERASMRFDWREDLMGNHLRRILHGGAIATAMDATAALVAFTGVLERVGAHASQEELESAFARLGTIDMRVDFLRPGMGRHFVASAHPLRQGGRVAVIRTELHNDDGELIASGTCTYMVG